MASFSLDDSKNKDTFSNESKDSSLTWNTANMTWNEATGTWASPKRGTSRESKNTNSLSNESKN